MDQSNSNSNPNYNLLIARYRNYNLSEPERNKINCCCPFIFMVIIGAVTFYLVEVTKSIHDDIELHEKDQNQLLKNICNVTYKSYSIEYTNDLYKLYVLYGSIEYFHDQDYNHSAYFDKYYLKSEPKKKIEKMNESITCYTDRHIF